MAVTQSLTLTEVAGSANVANKTSQVRILWTSTQSSGSYNATSRTAKYYVSINGGTETEYSVSYTLPKDTTKVILDKTITVTHKDDGTGTVKVRTWMDTRISAGVVQQSRTVTLTTIASASTITSATDVTLGEACSVKWTPSSAACRYRLKFVLGEWGYTTDAIHPNKVTEYEYSGYKIPLDVANQFTTRSKMMTVTLFTYSDIGATQQIGSEDAKEFKVTVPDNELTKPTVTMSIYPVSDVPEPFNSMYIAGVSKLQADIGYELKYGANESNVRLWIGTGFIGGGPAGSSFAAPFLTGALGSGAWFVTGEVNDSRGIYGRTSQEIYVHPYSKPSLVAIDGSGVVAARCDSSGKLSDDGTYLKIKTKIAYSSISSTNFCKVFCRYKESTKDYYATEWKCIFDTQSDSGNLVDTNALYDGKLDARTNYQVQIKVQDGLQQYSQITVALPTVSVYMDKPAGGKSMGLGGYATGDGFLDIFWRTNARGGLWVYNDAGDGYDIKNCLLVPRGDTPIGWTPDELADGVYVFDIANSLTDTSGNIIMAAGVLIQLSAAPDNALLIQFAFCDYMGNATVDPIYRIKWYKSSWGPWRGFKN